MKILKYLYYNLACPLYMVSVFFIYLFSFLCVIVCFERLVSPDWACILLWITSFIIYKTFYATVDYFFRNNMY